MQKVEIKFIHTKMYFCDHSRKNDSQMSSFELSVSWYGSIYFYDFF